jgi:septal ring factor EnvC (AmiA/AmiB activator)
MIRHSPGTVTQFLLGLIIALLLIPPPVAQAQWAVFDASNLNAHLKQWIKEAERWTKTIEHYKKQIDHYTKMFDKAKETVTNLTGILNKVEEEMARHKDLIGTVASVGETVRSLFTLKDKLVQMVTCKIQAVQNVWTRLRAGIFNPQQNMADLEEYLKYTIGRKSSQAIAHIEFLANQDVEFQEMIYQREVAYAQLAALREKMIELQDKLDKELARPKGDQQGVAEMQRQMSAFEAEYHAIVKRIEDLNKGINEKCVKYGVVLDERESFAKAVKKDLDWFKDATSLNTEVMEALEEAFDPSKEQPIEPTPDDFILIN